ncbi:MAG TPA: pyridoxal phosphate-dependent aminotransferase [Polyangiaceae bacterium]
MFSRRASGDASLNSLAELLRKTGAPRFDLTQSNAGIPNAALLEGVARATALATAYAPDALGLASAREAVARQVFGSGPAPDDVLLTASSSEAYSFLFKLLCDPGDAVLVPAPSYPLFEHLAVLEGVAAIPYRLAYDGAWHIDLDSLGRAVAAAPHARAIVVVSPNNPSGHYLDAREQAALEAHGLPLLVDEVFFEYAWQPGQRRRARDLRSQGAGLMFSLGGLSKLAGLPQLKLGWTVIDGPEPLRRAAAQRLELIADSYLSVGTPIQLALPELLAACGSATAAILARCRASLSTLSSALTGTPLTLLRADAGWSAVLQLPALKSEEAWVLGLLEEQSVLVQPGWFYDFEAEPYVIVSLLTPPAVFDAGIARLVQYVTQQSH